MSQPVDSRLHPLRLLAAGPGGAPSWVELGFEGDDVAETVSLSSPPLGDALADSPVYGTGLGLPIAHRLAALVGGRLEASTTRGIGNVFRLVMPIHTHLARRAD